MSERTLVGALVITVWWHDDALVARFRGFRRLDAPTRELGTVTGEEAILARLSAWLQEVAGERVNESK